jgi:hypothetical protein
MDFVLPKNFQAGDALQVLDRVRRVMHLPPDAQISVENVTQSEYGTRIDFMYTTSVELDDATLREIAGVRVDVSAHGDVDFDAHGELVSYQVEPADPRQLRALRDNISKLVARGLVYMAQPGEQINPDQLHAQGKPWYIELDQHGKKRLKRAWIS